MPFMRFFALVLIIAVFCTALVFMVQNKDQAASLIFFGSARTEPIPVYLIILGAFLVGVVFTSVIGIIEGMKMRVSNARLKRKARTLQEELDSLRNLPLSGPADEERSPDPGPADDDAL